MKVGCAQLTTTVGGKELKPDEILDLITECIGESEAEGTELILFPGCTGMLFDSAESSGSISGGFLGRILAVSEQFSIIICPGSYYQWEDDNCYHASALIRGGEILLEQRQLYLSHGEESEGLSRGKTLRVCSETKLRTAIILGTDIFYAPVGRQAAMKGAELVLSPQSAPEKLPLPTAEMAGLWREVQSNQFFGMANYAGGGSSIIEPIASGGAEDGYIVKSVPGGKHIYTELDSCYLRRAQKEFNVRDNLNPVLYRNIFRTESR